MTAGFERGLREGGGFTPLMSGTLTVKGDESKS
jgi:hypothetical protein